MPSAALTSKPLAPDNAHLRRKAVECLRELNAAHHRHHDIRQHELYHLLMRLEELQRLLPVRGHQYPVAIFL